MVKVKGGKVSTTFSRMIRCSFVDETTLVKYETIKAGRETCRALLLKSDLSFEDAESQVNVSTGKGDQPPVPQQRP
jgi:hypothetical protein